jgi:hypothetical protein
VAKRYEITIRENDVMIAKARLPTFKDVKRLFDELEIKMG